MGHLYLLFWAGSDAALHINAKFSCGTPSQVIPVGKFEASILTSNRLGLTPPPPRAVLKSARDCS